LSDSARLATPKVKTFAADLISRMSGVGSGYAPSRSSHRMDKGAVGDAGNQPVGLGPSVVKISREDGNVVIGGRPALEGPMGMSLDRRGILKLGGLAAAAGGVPSPVRSGMAQPAATPVAPASVPARAAAGPFIRIGTAMALFGCGRA
jgi:hypothetical protein